jgi:hypothetical protein
MEVRDVFFVIGFNYGGATAENASLTPIKGEGIVQPPSKDGEPAVPPPPPTQAPAVTSWGFFLFRGTADGNLTSDLGRLKPYFFFFQLFDEYSSHIGLIYKSSSVIPPGGISFNTMT